MKRKAYHRLELSMFVICQTDIVKTSGGGTGLEANDVWENDQTWTTY